MTHFSLNKINNNNKSKMGLEIPADIFKWLQNHKIVKEAKRTNHNTVQLSPELTNKFFDGLYISTICTFIFKIQSDQDSLKKLQAIKENSTPAIRLYNWNILTEMLKKLKFVLDYTDKSKILNLEPEIINKILLHLYELSTPAQNEPKNQSLESKTSQLNVELSEIAIKSQKQSKNMFEFLVICISKHFKLSTQHTLNLFLDNNKYLAHLFVKGVKNTYQPVYLVLRDILTYLEFIVDNIFCIDQELNVAFLFNAIKSCLISKDVEVARMALQIFQNLYQIYKLKNADLGPAKKWMMGEGINTLLFGLKRHSQLFSKIIFTCYSYVDWQLFKFLQPIQKSVMWINENEKLQFYRQFLYESNQQILDKFLTTNIFNEWSKYCLKALKKDKNIQQLFSLIHIFQRIWIYSTDVMEQDDNFIPNAYILFLKNNLLSVSDVLFNQSLRALFTLMEHLGQVKNSYAPIIYKTLANALIFESNIDRINSICMNFDCAFKDIENLPGSLLIQSLLTSLEKYVDYPSIQLCRVLLSMKKITLKERQNMIELLTKISFQDMQYGAQCVDIIFSYLNHQNIFHSEQQQADMLENLLDKICRLCLSQFYSLSKEIPRSLSDLKKDYQRYAEEQSMKKGQAVFLKNMQKYILISNMLAIVKKSIFQSESYKEQAEPYIFHTYVKIKHELKKMFMADLLLPLMKSYEDDEDQLQDKILYYQNQAYPQSEITHRKDHMEESVIDSPIKKDRNLSLNLSTLPIKSLDSSPSPIKATQAARKLLEKIVQKREEGRERQEIKHKQKDLLQEKKQLYRSVINEKRIIQFGKKNVVDLDYKCILTFDSFKPEDNVLGLPNVKLFKIQSEEEAIFLEDFDSLMKKYRKIWRFLFFKYSSFGLIKGNSSNDAMKKQQKINIAELWKMLREYQFDIIRKEQSHAYVRKINESMNRRNDLQNLTYLGFEEYILQICNFGYNRAGYAHIPPSKKVIIFLEQIKAVTGSLGGSTEMFDNPDEVYFQETEVIRQFNSRLKENQNYILPEGYKKIKLTDLLYLYEPSEINKKSMIKSSYLDVLEVLDMIFSSRKQFGFHLIQPKTAKEEKCLAKPALFQKLNEKMKEYKGGYLLPKRAINSTYLKEREKVSPVKVEFHPLINFSLGIKIGLASVDIRNRYIADQVAYWIDDMLDAVQNGKNIVQNKAKRKIDNQHLKKKRASAYQIKLEKQELQKKQKKRSETVKVEAIKFRQKIKEDNLLKRQQQKLQRNNRKQRQEVDMKKKIQEFQTAKGILNKKRDEEKMKKMMEIQMRKKQKEEYKKSVEEYFLKKRQELEEKQKTMKSNKQYQLKKQEEDKQKKIETKKKLEIEIFKKQQLVLQKIIDTKQTYEECWKSTEIQQQIKAHSQQLKYLYDLLLRYEKSKISATKYDELSFTTINFFALKCKIVPFMLEKSFLSSMFKSMLKNEESSSKTGEFGLSFRGFEELLFKIIVKAKQLLNSIIKKNIEKTLSLSSIEPNLAENEENQMQLSQLKESTIKKRQKKILTDQYTFNAEGVTSATVNKFYQFLNLPEDKVSAEEKFREMLQTKNSRPTALIIKQLKESFQ